VNPLSFTIIGGIISLLIIMSIILILMDIEQDNRLIKNNYQSDHQVLKTVFADLEGLHHANIFQFAFYVTMVNYLILY